MKPQHLWLLAFAVIIAAASASLATAEEPTEPVETPPPAPTVSPEKIAEGRKAFLDVAKVLLSPRCMNCHPTGDSPLQTDASRAHALNISRKSEKAGLKCATCHQTKNADDIGVVGGPPGAPNWHLPPEDVPMIFQGRTPAQLCAQLKNPSENGNKTLDELLHHVTHDALVLWGWSPGGNRTLPPLEHTVFVKRFKSWVESGGACPE